MPRVSLDEGVCEECENPVHHHEGPRIVRQFCWPVRTVARTLGRVADGKTYTAASTSVRLSSGRERGLLAADWVEAFSDDLWAALGPKEWPQFIVADSKPFYVRDWSVRSDPSRKPKKGERLPMKIAFTLLMVVGADAPARANGHWDWKPVVAVVVGGGRVNQRVWERVLRMLPGRPLGVTSDEDAAFFQAVKAVWPLNPVTGQAPPALNLCLFHAKSNFAANAAPASVTVRPYTEDADRLWTLFDSMADGRDCWTDFETAAMALGSHPVRAWLDRKVGGERKRDIIAAQVSRPFPTGPNSNSAAEAGLRTISGLISGRETAFRNAARTNRLLQLMVLAQRGMYDERRWAAEIDRAARARGGRTAANLRSIVDPAGTSSLR